MFLSIICLAQQITSLFPIGNFCSLDYFSFSYLSRSLLGSYLPVLPFSSPQAHGPGVLHRNTIIACDCIFSCLACLNTSPSFPTFAVLFFPSNRTLFNNIFQVNRVSCGNLRHLYKASPFPVGRRGLLCTVLHTTMQYISSM